MNQETRSGSIWSTCRPRSYVERNHGLPSLVTHGPGQGLTKHFFYPGFTLRTGGLLREPDLMARQAAFERAAWLARQGIEWNGERLVSLFCYEPAALGAWLTRLQADPRPTRLLVTHGRATTAVKAWFERQNGTTPASQGHGSLLISYLPALTQVDYDHLLWACDLNFVRGEDSLVRALWAGSALHLAHLPAGRRRACRQARSLSRLAAGAGFAAAVSPGLERHRHAATELAELPSPDLPVWQACALAARARLLAQDDLLAQLLRFVAKKR